MGKSGFQSNLNRGQRKAVWQTIQSREADGKKCHMVRFKKTQKDITERQLKEISNSAEDIWNGTFLRMITSGLAKLIYVFYRC